ncbi:hypothetical protein KSP39_PZI007307 [Platanthera zijinensis]|uniref:RRM domain-containing protein n=1 Tax=Platanthera zijinensis TaxID=2320716 RepID=A0AAP0BPK2_9ASPA
MGEQSPPSPTDAALTKVFVGGLAWETHREALCDHFLKFGDILEAVIITDKLTGRSKGYGFVTFKDADAAKKACEDSAPLINGRKANCNIAYLGARRGVTGKISPPASPAPKYAATTASARPAAVPWFFPSGASPSSQTASPFQQHYPAVVLPYYPSTYGYSPSFVTPSNMSYRTTPSHSHAGGAYVPGHFSYPVQGGGMPAPLAVAPAYHPMYQFHHHHHLSHSTGNYGISVTQFPPVTTVSSDPIRTPHTSNLPEAVPAIPASSHARLASAEAF